MGLARAFTRRLARPGSPDGSEAVVPKSVRPIISMPMGLISTTNQSVHDNPIISATHIQAVQQRQISSASSAASLNDSEASASTAPDTPGMTDTSSVESFSPIEPNHLSQYFPTPSKPAVRSNILSPVPEPETVEEPAFTVAPAIPKRAPSHSKREHERLSRIRSVRSSTSTGELNKKASLQESILEDVSDPSAHAVLPLRSPSRPSSTNATSLSRPASDEHSQHNSPFSQELRQLQEVAEEFASSFSPLLPQDRSLSELQREAAEAEEDVRVMHTKGLKSHRVSEYLNDISILRNALWDLTEDDDEDEDEEFHDAVDAWT